MTVSVEERARLRHFAEYDIEAAGSMCRDCADEDGRCPNRQPPCDPDEAFAEANPRLLLRLLDMIDATPAAPVGGEVEELETTADERNQWAEKRADDCGRVARDFVRLTKGMAGNVAEVQRLEITRIGLQNDLSAARAEIARLTAERDGLVGDLQTVRKAFRVEYDFDGKPMSVAYGELRPLVVFLDERLAAALRSEKKEG